MRILVTGAGGMLGHDLVRLAAARGHEVVGRARTQLDISDQAAVSSAVSELGPEAVVNCAAFTDVDGAEERESEALAVNGDGAGTVAAASARAGARLIHVSTDYVFRGDASEARCEDDATEPRSAYGRTKLAGEEAVRAAGGRFVIIRSAWLYGHNGKNFVDTIRRRAEQGSPLRVVDDQVGSPTWTVSLANAILNVLETDHAGVLHFANRGAVSWCGLAQAIVDQLRLGLEVAPISSAELDRKAPRPSYSVLDSGRYEKLTGRAAAAWRAALAQYLGGETDELH